MEINKIYNEDCIETLKKMPDNFLDLIVTSPPYNKGYWSRNRQLSNQNIFKTKSRRITYGDFDDNLQPEEYEKKQRDLINECLRVLKPSGSLFYNHIDILREHNTIHPKYIYDFPIKQIIIWDRASTPKIDISYFYPIGEYIFWLKKDKNSIPKFDRKNALFQKCIWKINPEKNNNHPAPFPLEIPTNIILATTNENDLVYDPYMGSGTTAIACVKTKRNYIGSELWSEYIDETNDKIKNLKQQLTIF
jgi:site-specific DNA-methyltransferase (adenine-specific)